MFVLPLVSNLSERWTALGQADLSELRISPNDSLTEGLYIDQTALAVLDQYPVSVPDQVQQSVSAQASCQGERWGTMGATASDTSCGTMRSVYGFSDEAVGLCVVSAQLEKACQGGNARACNEAALVDARLDREFRRPSRLLKRCPSFL